MRPREQEHRLIVSATIDRLTGPWCVIVRCTCTWERHWLDFDPTPAEIWRVEQQHHADVAANGRPAPVPVTHHARPATT